MADRQRVADAALRLVAALEEAPRTPAAPVVPPGTVVPEVAVEAAAAAGLRYVSDAVPGLRRIRRGRGSVIVDARGRRVRDERTLARVRRLAIPPAWQRVWIAPLDNAHLQATGYDARGRKQYRYHADWRDVRDATKYERLAQFARTLPRIRAAVERDLARPGLPRERVLATVVRLLETTFVRVGNARYAKENGSFGLTTLRNRHVEVRGDRVRFQFRGKSGKAHAVELSDRRVAAIVRRCRDLPGYELFRYVDAEGSPQTVDAADVNAYLHDIAGGDYTAKDFRTWGGTLIAALKLLEAPPPGSRRQTARTVAGIIAETAAELGNTPSICRKCYVHPLVLNRYAAGTLQEARRVPRVRGLRPEERRVLGVLERPDSRAAGTRVAQP
jgi:DNA topoisomerase-1